jgi:hypothetical protein
MNIILFALFLGVSYFILMQLYRFSTYHQYFKFMFPVLLGYGSLVGYLLFIFNFSNYFIWLIVLIIFFLSSNYKKQKQSSEILFKNEDEETRKNIKKSFTNTLKFHILSSVSYIVSLIVSFLYFYNR